MPFWGRIYLVIFLRTLRECDRGWTISSVFLCGLFSLNMQITEGPAGQDRALSPQPPVLSKMLSAPGGDQGAHFLSSPLIAWDHKDSIIIHQWLACGTQRTRTNSGPFINGMIVYFPARSTGIFHERPDVSSQSFMPTANTVVLAALPSHWASQSYMPSWQWKGTVAEIQLAANTPKPGLLSYAPQPNQKHHLRVSKR